jgi:hypothetical protein
LTVKSKLSIQKNLMRKSCVVLISLGCSLAFAACAQDTNALKTQIGLFETQTGVVLIKGFGAVGSFSTGAVNISVRSKATASLATGRKDYGIAIEIESNQHREWAIVDYEELEPLLRAMDYLGKITFDATPLPSFDASYTTKSGLRVSAFGSNRQGAIRTFVQYDDGLRIQLASDQFLRFKNLIAEAKTSLDAVREKNSSP